ncbi:DM4/DM12 family [Nesidiocoris tenuis]|uniref:DM4/DM12 family n=1 Tax=Nesidiocoris tenuis TaxID=355587 RepID=A0ABN7AJK9_9HEMI|nr:DM4/DM12 family [Nesidiocoris tenuis]
MTVKVLTPDDPDIFSEAVALATSYDLPNNTRALGLWPQEKEEASKLSRRQRSYVYSKAESILSKFGYPGKDCVLRTICEGAQQLSPADNILTEVVRVVLAFPGDHPAMDEPREQWVYLGAYNAGIQNYNCPDLYPACPFSLIGTLMSLRPTV